MQRCWVKTEIYTDKNRPIYKVGLAVNVDKLWWLILPETPSNKAARFMAVSLGTHRPDGLY